MKLKVTLNHDFTRKELAGEKSVFEVEEGLKKCSDINCVTVIISILSMGSAVGDHL